MRALLRIGLWMGTAVIGGCGGGGGEGGEDPGPAAPGGSATGVLDTDFNATGIVRTAVGPGHDVGYGVAFQPDGKIVVAGYSSPANTDFAVARYNTDGSLDASFGTGGKVTTGIGSFDIGYAVAVQPDGKILVAGYADIGFKINLALVRYHSDGSLDASFGAGGIVETAIGSGIDVGDAIALQTDGKIVVAGYSFSGTDNDFAVVRYGAEGSLDATFGTGGKVTTNVGPGNDYALGIALQSDGKIVAAGYSSNGANADFAVVRYNGDGSLDPSFNGTGRATTAVGSDADHGNAVVLQTDGKIVVAGYSYNPISFNLDFAAVRYNSDGSPDASFNGTGKVTTPVGLGNGEGNAVVLQPDGKIVVAGSFNTADFSVVRYNTDGSLDPSFNGTGKVTTDVGSAVEVGYGIGLQADGKIVVVGYSSNGANYDFAVVRYR